MRRLFLLCFLASGASAQDFSAVDALIEDSLAQMGGGAALVVVHDGEVVYRAGYGSITPETRVDIASATKWLSGAALATLISDGSLAVDDSLAMFFPSLEGEIRSVTIGQLFSHTSGFPGGSGLQAAGCILNRLITLGTCARRILDDGLAIPPGSGFDYGGTSMHVAGHIAELVTGQTWGDLFDARLAAPLGMTVTWNDDRNPRVAGGATTSANDLATFLQMLLAGGVHEGQQILSEEAIGALLADQTGGAPILSSPYEPYAAQYAQLPPVESIRYGLGVWREATASDGSLRLASSPGAFGTAPWIDLEAGIGAVLLVDDRLPDVIGTYLALQPLVRDALGVTVISEAAPEPRSLSVRAPWPNPVRHRAAVRFSLATPEEVLIALYDATGRRVRVLASGSREAGDHRVWVRARGLAPGVYRVVVRAGDETAVRAFAVAGR
ncbi:MAG: serine hydrolase [Bacteroidota bacterium]